MSEPRPTVVLLDDYQGAAMASADWSVVAQRAALEVYSDHADSEEVLLRRIGEAQVVVAMRERTRFPRELFERLPELELLVTTGMRNASIDLAAARDLGITVCGTGSTGYGTAELTWGLILGLVRHIPAEHQAVREGHWQTRIGDTVRGRCLGVVGLGRLGSLVAQIGLAFGMRVTAWSENLTDERTAELGVRRAASLADLVDEADVISIHTVLSRRTRGMFDSGLVARMKPTAYFVNTSRAEIVDNDALIEALRARRIAGAALDVFEQEPLPGSSPWRDLDNVIITPHIGHVTRENYRTFYGDVVEDIIAWWSGAPIRVINEE